MILLLGCAEVADTVARESAPIEDPEPGRQEWEAAQGLEFVTIPPGSFVMGSPPEEVGRMVPDGLDGSGVDREVQHEVTLTHTFRVMVGEVTREQFVAWMGFDPSTLDTESTAPVDTVAWHDAARFADALSTAAGLEACYTCDDVACDEAMSPYDCEGYRLPTEAEWEYAARAGETAAFQGGGSLVEDTEERCDYDLFLDNGDRVWDLAWGCGNALGTMHPGGAFAANAFGLVDMTGNAHEWTHDWYLDVWYLDPAASGEDPRGPSSGEEKVRRGGAWSHTPRRLRLAYRGWHDPADPNSDIGFRLLRQGSDTAH